MNEDAGIMAHVVCSTWINHPATRLHATRTTRWIEIQKDAVLSQGGPRDVTVYFGVYWSLQQRHTVILKTEVYLLHKGMMLVDALFTLIPPPHACQTVTHKK